MFGMVIPWYVKVLAVVGLLLGAYLFGRHDGNMQAELAIAKYEVLKKTSAAELEAEKKNIKEKIVTEYVEKKVEVVKKEIEYRDPIDNNKADEKTELSANWVCIHDSYPNKTDPKLCVSP